MLKLIHSAFEASSATNRLFLPSFDVVDVVKVDDGDAGGGRPSFFHVSIRAGAAERAGGWASVLLVVVVLVVAGKVVGY